jgi:hypothetical protein
VGGDRGVGRARHERRASVQPSEMGRRSRTLDAGIATKGSSFPLAGL